MDNLGALQGTCSSYVISDVGHTGQLDHKLLAGYSPVIVLPHRCTTLCMTPVTYPAQAKSLLPVLHEWRVWARPIDWVIAWVADAPDGAHAALILLAPALPGTIVPMGCPNRVSTCMPLLLRDRARNSNAALQLGCS